MRCSTGHHQPSGVKQRSPSPRHVFVRAQREDLEERDRVDRDLVRVVRVELDETKQDLLLTGDVGTLLLGNVLESEGWCGWDIWSYEKTGVSSERGAGTLHSRGGAHERTGVTSER